MRIIEVIADPGHLDTLLSIAEQHKVADAWFNTPGEGERGVLRMLVSDDTRQAVIDALQNVLGTSEDAHIIIQPVEAVLPRREEQSENGKPGADSVGQTREELYDRIQRDARLDSTFLLLVCLSTVVASIGLI
jgi:hypothetical protein